MCVGFKANLHSNRYLPHHPSPLCPRVLHAISGYFHNVALSGLGAQMELLTEDLLYPLLLLHHIPHD